MTASRSALLIVDVQNDFCPGGALPVPAGDAVILVLNAAAATAATEGWPIYASRDWHPPQTAHFASGGGRWPAHCVRESPGAAFHADLRLPPGTRIVTKGENQTDDGYSAFEGRLEAGATLEEDLHRAGVTHLVVGGLATDYCVRASVLDALKKGFAVTVLAGGIAGVEVAPGDSARALEEMRAAGAAVTP